MFFSCASYPLPSLFPHLLICVILKISRLLIYHFNIMHDSINLLLTTNCWLAALWHSTNKANKQTIHGLNRLQHKQRHKATVKLKSQTARFNFYNISPTNTLEWETSSLVVIANSIPSLVKHPDYFKAWLTKIQLIFFSWHEKRDKSNSINTVLRDVAKDYIQMEGWVIYYRDHNNQVLLRNFCYCKIIFYSIT